MKSADLARKVVPSAGSTPRTRSALPVLVLLLLLGIAAVMAGLFAGPPVSTPSGPKEAVFPLPERYAGSYTDDWGAPRAQGEHEGTDLFAPAGTPIRSITAGTVVRARGSGENGWNELGGYTVMVEAAYDAGPIRRGDLLYYAHMKAPNGFRSGDRVEAGQKIGEVGDTGQGPEGTRGAFEPHLHLGWYEGGWLGQGRSAVESGAMNPYPLLRRLERGEEAVLRVG